MALFFRGAITSSPIKTTNTQKNETCHSFDTSFLSDTSYECLSTNPTTGSVCVCRRSPRLLANGYYVLTEDSVTTDDEGNLTLTPTQTNISYKENLVRIFRRRHKVRRSFLSEISQSCQSWLGEHIFGRVETTPASNLPSLLDLSSSSTEQDISICFTYDPTETCPPLDKETFLPEDEFHTKNCSAPELPNQTPSGLLDVPPQSECLYNSYCPPSSPDPDGGFLKLCLFIILTLCLCATVFSRWVFGGVAVAVAFLFLILSLCVSYSGRKARWTRTRTEDITSRNE